MRFNEGGLLQLDFVGILGILVLQPGADESQRHI